MTKAELIHALENDPAIVAACKRLFEKYLIEQEEAELARRTLAVFFYMKREDPKLLLILPQIADWAWHEMVANTASYRNFCARLFADHDGTTEIDHLVISDQTVSHVTITHNLADQNTIPHVVIDHVILDHFNIDKTKIADQIFIGHQKLLGFEIQPCDTPRLSNYNLPRDKTVDHVLMNAA